MQGPQNSRLGLRPEERYRTATMSALLALIALTLTVLVLTREGCEGASEFEVANACGQEEKMMMMTMEKETENEKLGRRVCAIAVCVSCHDHGLREHRATRPVASVAGPEHRADSTAFVCPACPVCLVCRVCLDLACLCL